MKGPLLALVALAACDLPTSTTPSYRFEGETAWLQLNRDRTCAYELRREPYREWTLACEYRWVHPDSRLQSERDVIELKAVIDMEPEALWGTRFFVVDSYPRAASFTVSALPSWDTAYLLDMELVRQ